MNKPVIIGIAGGTGSGKTTVARRIIRHFGRNAAYIPHDNYYRDQSAISMEERKKVNYDHPDALETDLLASHLVHLRRGKTVEVPLYDFTTCNRQGETQRIEPAGVIVVEGILVFENENLRNLFDIKIFVDTDADIRLGRRIVRDMQERGRTLEFSLHQYLTLSRPMHLAFVEPSKKHADIVIPEGGSNRIGVQAIINTVEAVMKGPHISN